MNNLTPYREDVFNEMRRRMDSLRTTMGPNIGWDFSYPRSLMNTEPLTALMDTDPLNLNVAEDDDEIIITTNLPGVDEEDIDISARNNRLTISAEFKDEFEDSDEEMSWHARELRYGRFDRTVQLPTEVDLDGSDADLEKGVLTITLPKTEPGALHKIAIRAKQLLTD